MSAFDRVESGIPEMDRAINNIRLGDNVVWRVANLEQFRLFAGPYVNQAIRDHRDVYYIRFASHAPLIPEQDGVKVVQVELSHRFETFTVEIHHIIEKAGRDAFYVFDCLSELQTAWATDLMMGNFFQVTCPFLFKLDTVAFFPLIRGKHSFQAIAKIRETTQLFLDVYPGIDDQNVYVRPQKVWRRDSDTMFLPHSYNAASGKFRPILNGVEASRFYQILGSSEALNSPIHRDSWDRFFDGTKMRYEDGEDVTQQCSRMCGIMMTRDEHMRKMVRANFHPGDYFRVRERMIGTGMIGGKACGMLLARKIIQNRLPELYARLEPHDSFYVGSDVFYTYIVENDIWDLRVNQRTEEGYFTLAPEFADRIMKGTFSRDMEESFVTLLDYYGTDPFIVRSSSILEDGFGNAFAGKYESVFCSNAGSEQDRLCELEDAIRTVYASTMSMSALDYRKRRGLAERDEQMALLIQRVSGSRYDRYFMPCAAGVGYSYSPYRFLPELDPKAGMLRLVMGLGTSAVDRTEGSYPRLVSLDQPEKTSETSSIRRHQYSQRRLEAMDRETRSLKRLELKDIYDELPMYLRRTLLEHDYDTEREFRERGHKRDILFISCKGLVGKKELMNDMQQLMAAIQKEYEYPVDIEFTINVAESGEYVINLLQCRPLQVYKDNESCSIPENLPKDRTLLECRGASMGLSRKEDIDAIVYVDPIKYYEMPYYEKDKVAKAIGTINRHYRSKQKHLCLMVPGRVGTSSPELGVPTTFADISEFDLICEIAESKAGYRPELSYGSHFFQDLVEANILYNAVFENEKTIQFHTPLLNDSGNSLEEFFPELAYLQDIIGFYQVGSKGATLYYDMNSEHLAIVFGDGSHGL